MSKREWPKPKQTIVPELSQKREIPIKSAEARHFFVSVRLVLEGGLLKTRKAGGFVLKELKETGDPGEVDTLLGNFRTLRSNAFPVPPTYRILSRHEKTLLVTDLTYGGKFQIFSVNEFRSATSKSQFPVLKNYTEVERVVQELAQKADNLGFWLSDDVWFLQVDSDGLGRIILGDLGPKSMALSLASIKSDSVRGMLEDEKQRLPTGIGLSMDAARCFLQDVRKLLVR